MTAIEELIRSRDAWKRRHEIAHKVVSYIVIFGAAPTDRLAELITDAMRAAMEETASDRGETG